MHYNKDDFDGLVNLLKAYFNEFTKQETLYDLMLSEIEKKYILKREHELEWDDIKYLNDFQLYSDQQFSRLLLKFYKLFCPSDLKSQALI